MDVRPQMLKMAEMAKDKRQMMERILNHALGIIFLLTGEEYVVVKKRSPHNSIHTLTGEVPIKCGDISVYFSMEEWDYIEGHKDIYKDVIIEGRQVSDTPKSPENSPSRFSDEDADIVFIGEVVKAERSEADDEQAGISLGGRAGVSNGDMIHCEETNSRSHIEVEELDFSGDNCPDYSPNKNVLRESNKALHFSALTRDCGPVTPQQRPSDLQNVTSLWDTAGDGSSAQSHQSKEESNTPACLEDETADSDTCTSRGFQEESWTMTCSSDWTGEDGAGTSHGFKEEPSTIDCEATSPLVFQGESWSTARSWDHAIDCNTSMSSGYLEVSRERTQDQSQTFDGRNLVSFPLNQCEQNPHLLNERFSRDVMDGAIHHRISNRKSTCEDNEPMYTHPNPRRQERNSEVLDSAASLLHQRIHSGENDCEIQIPTSSNSRKSPDPSMSCTCHVCGKWFSKRALLIVHQRSHTGEKPYGCPQCGKCFASRSHLVIHYRTHTGEKPYVCTVCEKSFAKRTNLDRHFRIHTREKPYMCPVCGKRFTRRSNVITHQTTHTGEKPYSCPECGKCFTQRSHMVIHHKTHLGERPYICSVCGKGFAKKAYLDVHQRTHKAEKANLS